MMQSHGRHSKRFLLFRKTQPIQFLLTVTSANLTRYIVGVMAVEKSVGNVLKSFVTPVLDEWLKQGNETNPTDQRAVINALCEPQRYDHALQRMRAYRRKGSGGQSSHHPGYYGGCGGGDGSRADDKVVVSVLILTVALAVDVIVVVVDVV
ncbi:unnamed protein product, partial [Brassica oleracea var. botrytis]